MAVANKVIIDKRGMKRLCAECGTGFYDFNNRPIICPSCDTEFTGKLKAKTRRGKAAAIAEKDKAQAKKSDALKKTLIDDQDQDQNEDDIDDADKDAEDMQINLDDAEDVKQKNFGDDTDSNDIDLVLDSDSEEDDLDTNENKSLKDELEEEGPDGAVIEDET